MRIGWILFFIFLLPIHPERIHFKNGDILTVSILRLNGDYALVTSPLGDYRIRRDQIKKIENTQKLPMQVKFKSGETLVLQFLDADEVQIRFLKDEDTMSYTWAEIEDSHFLGL